MVSDSHRVQPFVAHGSPKLPRTAVLLLQPSIATKAVVGAAQHTWHAQYYGHHVSQGTYSNASRLAIVTLLHNPVDAEATPKFTMLCITPQGENHTQCRLSVHHACCTSRIWHAVTADMLMAFQSRCVALVPRTLKKAENVKAYSPSDHQ